MTLAQFNEKHGDMISLQTRAAFVNAGRFEFLPYGTNQPGPRAIFPIWSGCAARTPRVGFMAIVDIWSGLIYIADKYAIPFKMAPAAFFGHAPEVHWFRK